MIGKMITILLSVRPEWVAKIHNGEKLAEIRGTIPKKAMMKNEPIRVCIYCTKDTKRILAGTPLVEKSWKCWNRNEWSAQEKKDCGYGAYNGKVVSEFILNMTECFTTDYRKNAEQTARICKLSCVSFDEMADYEVGKPCLFAWHISHLHIYDKPKELHEFGNYETRYSKARKSQITGWFPLRRPPQSYCYVEEKC